MYRTNTLHDVNVATTNKLLKSLCLCTNVRGTIHSRAWLICCLSLFLLFVDFRFVSFFLSLYTRTLHQQNTLTLLLLLLLFATSMYCFYVYMGTYVYSRLYPSRIRIVYRRRTLTGSPVYVRSLRMPLCAYRSYVCIV